ncbi:MAG: hypothetical protein IKM72_01965, partial [Oscillospiraceae bacterium]|nr:hypothetical protein [Oscillospiraceae bacterium]
PLKYNDVSVTGDGLAENDHMVCKAAGEQVIPGICTNTIEYRFSDGTCPNNYILEKKEGQLIVRDRTEKYSVVLQALSAEYLYDGKQHDIEGFESLDTYIGSRHYRIAGITSCASGLKAGIYQTKIDGIPAVEDEYGNNVTSQFDIHTIEGCLQIRKRKITVSASSAIKEYDGKPLRSDTVTVEGDGFAENEYFYLYAAGEQLLPGISTNQVIIGTLYGTDIDNYDVTIIEGKLEVLKRQEPYVLILQANSDRILYDGKKHTLGGFCTTVFTVDDNTYSVSDVEAFTEGKDAGTYENNITGEAVVTDEKGNDVTSQFIIKKEPGTLTIEKRKIILVSENAAKEFDGASLKKTEVTLSGDGPAEDDKLIYSAVGEIIFPGSCTNTIRYQFAGDVVPENYSISLQQGLLTVVDREIPFEITIESESGEFVYDGTAKTAEGIVSSWFLVENNWYMVSGISALVKAADAGTYSNPISGDPIVYSDTGVDVSNNFSVIKKEGCLTINKRNT